MMIIFFIGAAAVLAGSFGKNDDARRRSDQKTADALAQAKAALIGYAVADPNRPGELPCPDFNNDGESNPTSDYSGSNCKTLVGWLPWKRLRLPDLRDGSGERLWYAVANDFHANGTTPLNSGVSGALSITGSQPASNLVAIVFAPGAPLQGQVRPILPNTFFANTDVAKYLEANNALSISNVNFVTGNNTAVFNDRLLPISHDELFGVVNKRMAAEIRGNPTGNPTSGLYYAYATSRNQLFPLASSGDGNAGTSKSGFVPYNDLGFPAGTKDMLVTNNHWLDDSVTYTVANDQKTAIITVASPSVSLCLTPTAATLCTPSP